MSSYDHVIQINMSIVLAKTDPEKSLLIPIRETGGRNASGRITVRHRGGGVKRLYRLIDFGQEHLGVKGTVARFEYDPNRSAYLALVNYSDGEKGYILAPARAEPGQEIVCAEKAEIRTGNRMKLQHIPVGTLVYNVELEPGKGGRLVRGAGAAAQVLAHEGNYTHIALPSSEVRKVLSNCFAAIGSVSNPEHQYRIIRKAGSERRKGRRPEVRGKAMNPRDHPHGGGEGRNPIGLKYPKTPWGKHALGVKTRRKKKWTSQFIVQRRKKHE